MTGWADAVRVLLFSLCAVSCDRVTALPVSPVSPETPAPIGSSNAGVLSLAPQEWPALLFPVDSSPFTSPNGLTLRVPTRPGTISTLATPSVPRDLTGVRFVVSLNARMSSPVWWYYDPCGADRPYVRLWIFTGDWSDTPAGSDARWYSQDRWDLTTLTGTLDVPTTDLARWSNVTGQRASDRPSAFASALTRVSHVGVVFGGDCFAAHGFGLTSGSADVAIGRFELR